MLNDSPGRGKIRLTRRGRGALLVTGALVAGAAVAVPLLLLNDSSERPEAVVIPEGWRTSQVYKAVDKALGVPDGSSKKAAAKAKLKLPHEANGNPEGYLFPATYPIAEKSTPESVLSYMVATAGKKFGTAPISAGAENNAVSVYQTVTIASIAQAEAESKQDMGKVARVVLNRLAQGMPLQMDSTVNYALNRSTLHTKTADTKVESPYNTYARMGLPPTPIANPGDEAMRAATSPPAGDWLYFVTVKKGDTRFTADFEEHQRNVDEFNRLQKQQGKSASS
ncbi:putative aminodeoxychorismate lyase [Streptomyces sp. YIM 130001]|uniref:endolytic transglycosylase MltG n=1 Tax=Streptomyces sp. YIM 130001 TaxID=2259644 RepID=UPI000E651F77|nr:endolytic transglycosylase MltG [Streptomyces sp. YIM 130001]RII09384.1 putative aminodeoxychorismate lyase [Streptomyces sp. YIM 130001]